MKAIVQQVYGPPLDTLHLADVEDPVVGPTDVLLEVEAAGVNAADWHLVTGEPLLARLAMGIRRPKRRIPGSDVTGRVRAVGARVTRFRAGDAVVGLTAGGAFAQLAVVPEARLVARPDGMEPVTAAALPLSGTTALQAVRDVGRVREGHRVLVTGASGGVGSAAVQLAHAAGAHVTGVCRSENVQLVRSLGADAVIDRTRQPVPGGDGPYDVIIHVAGRIPLRDLRSTLTRTGALVLVSGDGGRWAGPIPVLVSASLRGLVSRQHLRPLVAAERAEDVRTVLDACAQGVLTPTVERTYDLTEAAAAVDHVWRGRTCGKVVITT